MCMLMKKNVLMGVRGKGTEERESDEVGFYSRLDFGIRWSPLPDEFLTSLHNPGIPRLLVV